MPFASIDKPNQYFDTKLYTGTGSTQSISGINFSPDLVWIKQRSAIRSHVLYDVIRGATKDLRSNDTTAEATDSATLSAFNSDGFTVVTDDKVNVSSGTYASWNWKANGAGSSNTSGSITSTVSANTTSGFSIVAYQGTSVAGTIGHGLGVAPKMIIIKRRTAFAEDWLVYHASLGATKNLKLNTTAGEATSSSPFNNTAPTSTVFSVSNDGTTNSSSSTYIAYCFAEVKGYSKFGSYTGNGSSSDGTFAFTGFKPAFILIKRTDAVANWFMYDTKRNTYNATGQYGNYLWSNSSQAEAVGGAVDFYSNGFKLFTSWTELNASGGTYIYMAFAENPFVSSKGIPTTAR